MTSTRITTLMCALLATAGLTLTGCNKRDDMPPTGAGPGTTTTTPSDSTGTPGSMTPTTPTPSASAASQ